MQVKKAEANATSTPATVLVRVELFGLPRLIAGTREVTLELPADAAVGDAAAALSGACPALVGRVIREDRRWLVGGYAFNRNGEGFLERPEAPLALKQGESLLLLSNMAGG